MADKKFNAYEKLISENAYTQFIKNSRFVYRIDITPKELHIPNIKGVFKILYENQLHTLKFLFCSINLIQKEELTVKYKDLFEQLTEQQFENLKEFFEKYYQMY